MRFASVRSSAVSLLLCCALSAGVLPSAVQAQSAASADTADAASAFVPERDRRGLRAVYERDGPVVTGVMRGVDAAAYPLFYGAAPAAWGAALLRGEGYAGAYRLTLAEGLAVGAALGLKKVFGRPRPYRALPAVRSRSARYEQGREGRFPEAFPSGHAAGSFALATSLSLSHPEAYVVAPAAAGAALSSVSRLWLGVHYPSDVLAGALLGAGLAVGVHVLRGAITPGAWTDDATSGEASVASPQRLAPRGVGVTLLRVRVP
jgi:membrane-associated phospholipid phosphatase